MGFVTRTLGQNGRMVRMTQSYVLTVADVVRETADACSVVFDVPAELSEAFTFVPGQFLTLAIPSDLTGLVARCYSISSTPHSGRLQVTVKRTADGYASNWINSNLKPGDQLRVLTPSGIFTPSTLDEDFLLFAGGSGITPILSIAQTTLEKGSGHVVLVYANRDAESVIFAEHLGHLLEEFPDRFDVVHWLESEQGLPTTDQIREIATRYLTRESFVCGPGPFMKAVTTTLKELEVPRSRRHQEKFVSLGGNPFGDVVEEQAAEAEMAAADAVD